MLPTVMPLRSPVAFENAEVTQAQILHALEKYTARARRCSIRSVRRRWAQQTLGDHKRPRCRGNVVWVDRQIVAPQASELALGNKTGDEAHLVASADEGAIEVQLSRCFRARPAFGDEPSQYGLRPRHCPVAQLPVGGLESQPGARDCLDQERSNNCQQGKRNQHFWQCKACLCRIAWRSHFTFPPADAASV